MAIQMLTEYWKWVDEHSENFNKEMESIRNTNVSVIAEEGSNWTEKHIRRGSTAD